MTEKVKETLAAGSLTNLISNFHESWIDEIIKAAEASNKFKDVLSRVDKEKISKTVWDRFENVIDKPVRESDFKVLFEFPYRYYVRNICMTDDDLNELIEAWIAAADGGNGSQIHEENFWAIEIVMDLREHPEELWRFVLADYRRPMSDKAQSLFAAAPLEDIFYKEGHKFIDRVEELAKNDPLFKDLLGGCWRPHGCTDEIWARIEAAREFSWDD